MVFITFSEILSHVAIKMEGKVMLPRILKPFFELLYIVFRFELVHEFLEGILEFCCQLLNRSRNLIPGLVHIEVIADFLKFGERFPDGFPDLVFPGSLRFLYSDKY